MAEETRNLPAPVNAQRMPEELPESVRAELEALSSTQKAAVLMLLLGEQQAADIIKYMSPKEVQALQCGFDGHVGVRQAEIGRASCRERV